MLINKTNSVKNVHLERLKLQMRNKTVYINCCKHDQNDTSVSCFTNQTKILKLTEINLIWKCWCDFNLHHCQSVCLQIQKTQRNYSVMWSKTVTYEHMHFRACEELIPLSQTKVTPADYSWTTQWLSCSFSVSHVYFSNTFKHSLRIPTCQWYHSGHGQAVL